ncbi:HTH-type transcriptional regulator CynR [Pigmentiphaga humi]|uniref:HTH-type transcriptional regulator CynR n=1 Tax=Pigmentiphaga humi TaxID=2478468 RepID=A0A3P4B545_9BURK|nr:LysR family transcriptional regulator [Pigmentiphaga humi]VCU71403.1 HTH-type transcriptional regulator CynR [Pigmentiphaga humi]
MDLRQLEYFIYVAELGSFTQAAAVLGVGQPALSRQVRKLEVALRQTLFYRNGRGVRLTEAGKRLLAHGRTIQLQVEHARHDVEDARGTPLGRVIIGFPYAVGRMSSTAFVKAFRHRYPRANLCITEGLTIHLQEWLLAGRIDIALLHDPVPSPSLDIQPIREDDLLLLGYKKHSEAAVVADIPLRRVAELPLIIPCRPHPLRMMVETRLANMGLKPQVALEIDAVATIVNLVAQGEGYAVVTRHAVAISAFKESLQLRRIIGPRMSSVLALATSSERPLTTLVHRTKELLLEQLAAPQA